MSVLLDLSLFPLDQGEGVSGFVAPVIAMIRESGLPYRLTPMGTIIETENLAAALSILERAYGVLAEQGCARVYATAKFDIRSGHEDRLAGKIAAVEQRIGPVAT